MIRNPKNIKDIDAERKAKYLKEMFDAKKDFLAKVDKLHVYFAQGNMKTNTVRSVSLMPILNCGNCEKCANLCYDIRNDCCYKGCRTARARNAAILEADPERYFKEIETFVATERAFRYHIGGDIVDMNYLENIVGIAERTPHCEFLIFTKMFKLVNDYLREHKVFPKNFHLIFSNWVGQEQDNPFNLPTSNPLFQDGSTTAHDGAQWCSGDCTECFRTGEGCWTLSKSEEIIFPVH